jgi:hypothetical protein
MFATFVCDLYQRMLNQERIKENTLNKTSSGRPWASMRAYFAPPPARQAE